MTNSLAFVSRSKTARSAIVFPLALALLAFAFLLSISVGAANIPLSEVWRLLFQPDDTTESLIVQSLRLPRAVVGTCVGACLGVSGAIMQGLTRNPLASPGILGVNGGAAFAILVMIVFFPSLPLVAFVPFAFLGGVIAAAIVYAIAASVGLTPLRLALSGVAVASMFAAASSGVQILFEERSRGALFSLAGSLSGRTWTHVEVAAPITLLALVAALCSSQLVNLIALGEDVARGLGVRLGPVKAWLAVVGVLLAAVAVSVAGPIAFVGLMIPHVCRGLVGPDYRAVMPLSALLGAGLVLLGDVGARVVDRPLETPVGIVITAIGAPFFVYLARKLGTQDR